MQLVAATLATMTMAIAPACASAGASEVPSTPPATAPPRASAPPAASAPPSASATASADGLEVELVLPDQIAAGTATATLRFRNRSDHAMRLLLVKPERFRMFNSTFRVIADGKVSSLQPMSPPHGHLVDEDDFFVLAAGAARELAQSLELPTPGTFAIEWRYANQQHQFAGGASTLDGPSKPLFGGGVLADLWTGSLTLHRTVVVH